MRRATLPGSLLLVLLLSSPSPVPLRAQEKEAAAGVVAGAVAGSWWALGLVAARSRGGDVLLRANDLRPTLIPMLTLGVAAGAATGIWAEDRLWPALGWGAVGSAAGFGGGYLVGKGLWEDDAGPWAGAVIGSGAGLVIGAVLGALAADPDEDVPPGARRALFRFSYAIPVGR